MLKYYLARDSGFKIRLFQKQSKKGGGVEDMEFPGALKKEHVEIPGVK